MSRMLDVALRAGDGKERRMKLLLTHTWLQLVLLAANLAVGSYYSFKMSEVRRDTERIILNGCRVSLFAKGGN